MSQSRDKAQEQAAEFRAWLKSRRACEGSLEWLDGRTQDQAWAECERGDWLLWWATKRRVKRKLLVRAACACARLALPHVPPGELQPLRAIETAERWCEGKATLEEVWMTAAYSTTCFFSAAMAATYAAEATTCVRYAAIAAEYAAYAASPFDVDAEILKECATLVRQVIPFEAVRR